MHLFFSSFFFFKVFVLFQEWIVHLRGYHDVPGRRAILEEVLLGMGGWEEVPRDNAAYELPSDFVVLRTDHSCSDHVVSTLRSRGDLVRSVSPQLRVEGGLLSTQQPTETGPSEAVPVKLDAPVVWARGVTGKGVRVVIFDTGLNYNAAFLNFVADRRDWTNEKTVEDGVGHGTFVASMVAGTNIQCMGMAPDAEVYIYRVFTVRRVSFTAWFLDAFNYAIHAKMDILNLSIGGPDFMDRPFVEKVSEVTSSGITMVSAIGNDGPLYGTLNNPADMSDVIGVGGLGRLQSHIALFSSRGMTTWELPGGYGRAKPDVVTYGTQLKGADRSGGCMEQSGTSMASPVVAGAVALIISSLSDDRRKLANPGSLKQVLIESAVRVPRTSLFEQGAGRLNLPGAVKLMESYVPHVSFHPPYFDTTECPYFAPYCEQPIYYSAMPLMLNATLLNGMAVTGRLKEPPTWKAGTNGQFLKLSFDWPEYVWPWSGYIGIRVQVNQAGATFQGVAEAVVSVTVISPHHLESTVELPLRIRIIPTPPRNRRILWDQYHNARYPPGYFPRDDLLFSSSPFDWNADHIHTNFLQLFRTIRKMGMYVEVLGEPWTCFDAQNYGALLVVDPEEELWEEEQRKLEKDIRVNGLSLVVLADWYNVDVMKRLRFDDQNTRQQWTPVTGGAHLPALNDFLEVFGVGLTTSVLRGLVNINGRVFEYSSGTSLGAFPQGSHVLYMDGMFDQKMEILEGQESIDAPKQQAIGGWFQLSGPGGGRVVIFGDSSFVDGAGRPPGKGDDKTGARGYWMMEDFLTFAVGDLKQDQVLPTAGRLLKEPLNLMTDGNTPRRLHMTSILRFSRVLHRKQSGEAPTCIVNAKEIEMSGERSFNWESFKAKMATLSSEVPPTPVDQMLLQRVLAPKNVQESWFRVPPIALVLVALGIVFLVFMWIFDPAGVTHQNNQNNREKLISSI